MTKIIIGKKYKLIGKGGCHGGKCKDCFPNGIQVIEILGEELSDSPRNIRGRGLYIDGQEEECSFRPDDLVLLNPGTLKELIGE